MKGLSAGPGQRGKRATAGGGGPDFNKFLKLTQEHQARERSSSGTQQEARGTSLHDLHEQGGVPFDGTSSSNIGSARQSGGATQPEKQGRGFEATPDVSSTHSQNDAAACCDAGASAPQPGAMLGGHGEDGSTELQEQPSDVLAAIQLLHSQFPKVRKKVDVLPVILRTQVYSIVKNRTDVDREAEVLKHRRRIRLFKLVTSGDDYAIMLWDDYTAQVRQAQAQAASKSPPEHVVVFDWFLESVLPGHVEVGISHALLWRLLSGPGRPPVREYHVSLLLQAGLLVRQLADSTAFWFAIPNVGLLVKSVVQGRKELIGYLSRRKYREMLHTELSRKNLRYSILGMRFHLRDLLGSGKAFTVSTTVGPLIRLARD
ncbi:hypothetical protein KFL_006330060 [Klebsormidium nitens]|uniref:Uncharacterized protein n=1 Tax=Klebsormidium nitens TaxID=105231 RepID=A0A1Y1ILQ5_KLENI|nr:hypothetical protein KFL_006330060 [Klebsormidium nitens]|eukprot:GAQ90379.1 hypothetical protein KFL_006330060 [Klebsormidium nitens]